MDVHLVDAKRRSLSDGHATHMGARMDTRSDPRSDEVAGLQAVRPLRSQAVSDRETVSIRATGLSRATSRGLDGQGAECGVEPDMVAGSPHARRVDPVG